MRDAGEPHLLVDTREESEWAAGHVAGAVHLSKGIIERDIETKVPDKDTKAGALLRRRLPLRAGRRQSADRWATRTPSRSMADGAR